MKEKYEEKFLYSKIEAIVSWINVKEITKTNRSFPFNYVPLIIVSFYVNQH